MASPSTPKPNLKRKSILDYFSRVGGSNRQPGTKSERRKALAEYVVLDELPVDIVDSQGFGEFSMFLDPGFAVPSSNTVAGETVKLFKEEKAKLKEVVKLQRISVSASAWMTIHEHYYMCVTAHWIDDSWALQKRVIGFFLIPDFEGDTVAEELENCFNDWGITELQSVTMDNALSNDTTIDLLKEKLKEQKGAFVLNGSVLHMKCVCDIVNSIVKDGLKELAPSIARIRNALKYVYSGVRLKMFKECIVAEGIESKTKLFLDIETTWNTTYKMLDGALVYKRAFDRMKDNAGYRNYFDDADREAPADSDWENAKIFVQYLKPFYNLVLRLSFGSSPKSNFCFSNICEAKRVLLMNSQGANDLMRQMAVKMDAKFVEHWGDPEKINRVFFLAMVLDPRYKMRYLGHCLRFMYEAEAAQKLLKDVKASLYQLSDEYNDAAPPPPPHPTGLSPNQQTISSRLLLSFMEEVEASEGGPRNEVDRYLSASSENILAKDFDVLAWWRANAHNYKVLSRIAKDVLAVPVSSLSPDSVFSVGGRFLDAYRSELSYTMLEVLVCTKSWLTARHDLEPREFTDDMESILCDEYDEEATEED